MLKTDVVVIGGGQAGLAMSRSLTARDIDHVVLERGRIGERWYAERWHSLNLLTVNTMSVLPGLPYAGDEPEGFMPASAFAAYLGAYAQAIAAPVINGVEVVCVEADASGYRVSTTAGQWLARAVVIATGACETPFRPLPGQALAPAIHQMFPTDYRAPDDLPHGGVLVVGASATGAQLAEEIHASGRPVILAVGEHTRLPRRYRGGDVYAWMDKAGILDDPAIEGGNIEAARRQPSLQLVGRPDNRDLHLGILADQGIHLVGRLAAVDGAKVSFGGNLAAATAASHTRMLRVLERIDACIDSGGLDAPEADPAARAPFLPAADAVTLDLQKVGIRSVVWASGYIRRYPWLKLPVLDSRGEIVHRGGVTPAPGLYTLGLVFMRRRRSSFIDGCARDADDLAPLVKAHLDLCARNVA